MEKTTDSTVDQIVEKLRRYVNATDGSPFSYERSLLMERGRYLDAFIEGASFPPFEVEIQMSSRCNLSCRWCIGREIQAQKKVLNLPNAINKDNVERIVDGIIGFREGHLGIESVKFSGFIGEPLVLKDATIRAMQRLVGAGLQTGLYTNGVFMIEDTWQTLSALKYVHVSLDAGPTSFYWLKEDSPGSLYTEATFDRVLDNIRGLNQTRISLRKPVMLDIGYVIVPGNHTDIYRAAKAVKDAGADRIRFKCDIVGKHDLAQLGVLDAVFQQIEDAKTDFHDPPRFSVYSIHSRSDIENKAYARWKCSSGCYYQHFVATIGSNGNMYLCDHNTMPAAVPFGNVIDEPFERIWRSERREYLQRGVKYLCECAVCPPFGNRANIFLKRVEELCREYGREAVAQGVDVLRTEC